MKTLLHRLPGPTFCLCYFSILVLLIGCTGEQSREKRQSKRLALQAAASDLRVLGSEQQAAFLMEEAWRLSPSLDEAKEIARQEELLLGEGVAGPCLERLYPSPQRPAEVSDFIFQSYLEDWQWQQAREALGDQGDDSRLNRLQDMVSRTRHLTESFNPPFALSWRVQGCETRAAGGSFFVSSPDRTAPEQGVYTSVGWDGEGFRQSVEIKVEQLQENSCLIWGLAASPRNEPVTHDTEHSAILLCFCQSEARLVCDGPVLGDRTEDKRSWYLPTGRWIGWEIEYFRDRNRYFQDGNFQDSTVKDQTDTGGEIRAYVKDLPSQRRLLFLKVRVRGEFLEGHMAAGLFQPLPGKGENRGSWTLFQDNFSFDN